MGLTRPRAAQIYDIDYKQAVRVITTTNITLLGGAPLVVDGVTLSLNDRILVSGQSTASQNGIYKVTVTGTGSNGTWARTSDNDATGELLSGTIVMVTEGSVYADTSWKLTTNNPITIGTTALTFEINTGNAFGVISANGTSVVANSATGTVTFSTGNNIVITGNATTDTITFAVKDSPTFYGSVLPGANVTYDLGTTTSRWKDIYLANSTIYLGNAQISANATAVIITNPAGGTTVLSGASPAVNANTVVATGNITGGNLITSGVLSATGNANVGNLGATNANLTAITVSGNADVGNLGTAGQITATGNITGGNINLSGNIVDTGALFLITGSSGNVTLAPNGTNVVVATTTGANVTGTINATGNITAPNFIGNLAGTANVANFILVTESPDDNVTYNLPYVSPSGSAGGYRSLFADDTGLTFNPSTNILTVALASHATSMSTPNVATTTTTGTTSLFTTITSGTLNMMTGQTSGPLTIGGTAATGAIAIGRSTATQTIAIGNGVTASGSTKTISIGTLGAAGSTTNISVGPVAGNGTVSFLANAIVSIANSLSVSGNANITGNVSGANLLLSGNIFDSGTSLQINTTSAANIALAPNSSIVLVATTTGANITGTLNATGNANVGNLDTAGLITVTGNVNAGGFSTAGNVTGSYFLGNVACASGIFTTKIFNGTSEANIVSSGGNMAISIGGTSNVMVVSTGGANISGTLGATGNITGGNLSGTLLTGTLDTAAQPNVTSVGTLTSLTASGNISGGNLVTTGTVSTGTLTASGNVTVAGNLTVSGNVISVNVTNLNVVDPIIGLGRGANNTPLTSNDGKDRGQELWYYTTTEQAAFMGYDNSAGKLIAATNVTVSNDVVTVNNYGNLIVGGLESTTISATGNITGGNLVTAGQLTASGNITGNYLLANITFASGYNTTRLFNGTSEANIGTANGNLSITIAGTSNVMVVTTTGVAVTGTSTVSGNANVGNLGTAGQITATGNITGGNINLAGNIVDTGALTLVTGSSGNVSLAPNGTNVIVATTTGANIAGTLNATGNANVGNLGTAGLIVATGNITTVGNISGGNILGNGRNLSGIETFRSFAVAGGNTITADSILDTFTFNAGTGITLVADPDTDTLTIAASGEGSDIFVDGADFGTVDEVVTTTDDLGSVADAVTSQADLGSIVTAGVFYPDQLVFPSYTVATVPSASPPGQMIYVSNESGGAVPAFSDGTNWRRVTDRAIIT